MANSLGQETILSLKTEIDNDGVRKFLSLLDSNKIKSLATGAALAALTKAVYSFVSATVKEQYEIERLSKKQKQGISNTRAQHMALQAMGKTMQEIEKDASLKKIYQDIYKFNKQLEEQMPSMGKVIENVNKLRTEFYKLKSAVYYTFQSIGAQVLTNLEYPMDRIGGKMRSMSEWIRDRLPNISITVSRYMTAFAKGVIAIGETLGKVGEVLNGMPSSIKGIVGALGVLFGLIKGGPLGQILAVVSVIGDVIHDYENYQWNKANGFERGNERYVKNLNDRFGIWDVLDGPEVDEEGKTRGERFATKILTIFTESINSVFSGKEGEFVLGNLLTGEDGQGGIFGSAIRWMDDNEEGLTAFGQAVLKFANESIKFVGGFSGSAMGNLFNKLFGNGTVDESVVADETTATTFATGLGGFVNGLVKGLKDDKNFIDAAQVGLKEGIFGAIMGAITSNMVIDDQNGVTIDWSKVQVDLTKSGESFISVVVAGMGTGIDLAGSLLDKIGGVLAGASIDGDNVHSQGLINGIGQVFSKWSNNDTVVGGLTTAIATALAGGNLVQSLVGGIFGSYMGARTKAEKELYERARKHAGQDSKKQTEINKMSVDEVKKYLEGEGLPTEDVYKNIFSDMSESMVAMVSDLFTIALDAAVTAGDLGGTILSSFLNIVVSALANPKDGSIGTNLEKTISALGGNEIFGSLGVMIGTRIAGGNFWTSLVTGLTTGAASINDLANEQFDGDFGKALQFSINEFYGKILDMWYGPEGTELDAKGNKIRGRSQGLAQFVMPILEGQITEIKDETGKIIAKEKKTGGGILGWLFGYDERVELVTDETGNVIEKSVNRVKGVFEKAWSGDDGTGGIVGWITNMWDGGLSETVHGWIDTVGTWFAETLSSAFDTFVSGSPILTWIFGNQKKSGLKTDENGNVVVEDIAGTQYSGDVAKNFTPEAIKFLSAILPKVRLNSDGTIDREALPSDTGFEEFIPAFTRKMKEELNIPDKEWDSLSWSRFTEDESLSGTWYNLIESVLKGGAMPMINGNELSASTLFSYYNQQAGEGYKIQVPLDVNTDNADKQLQTEFSKWNKKKVEWEVGVSGEEEEEEAWGGRIGSEGVYTVGEDGAEYIIPITKPERAISLIKQMLSEMGSSAIERVVSGFGIGESGAIGYSPKSMASALQGMSMANNYNISAPISINVQSYGSDARAIGSSIYDSAEGHLMKTLRGVSA